MIRDAHTAQQARLPYGSHQLAIIIYSPGDLQAFIALRPVIHEMDERLLDKKNRFVRRFERERINTITRMLIMAHAAWALVADSCKHNDSSNSSPHQ